MGTLVSSARPRSGTDGRLIGDVPCLSANQKKERRQYSIFSRPLFTHKGHAVPIILPNVYRNVKGWGVGRGPGCRTRGITRGNCSSHDLKDVVNIMI